MDQVKEIEELNDRLKNDIAREKIANNLIFQDKALRYSEAVDQIKSFKVFFNKKPNTLLFQL